MAHIPIPVPSPGDLQLTAETRWATILADRPELSSAVDLQRRLLDLVIGLRQRIEGGRLPRLSLPPKYLAAKLAKGVPVLTGEPIPLPAAVLGSTLVQLCGELATSGAGEAAEHIRTAVENGSLDLGGLLSASLSRDQDAIRAAAVHHGLAPDLVWLVAELTVGPFAYILQRKLFNPVVTESGSALADPLTAALDAWPHGYCPACGSWPAMAEVVDGHRVLRCSFCTAGWELPTYACVYCGEDGEPFVTAAPNEERKDRRVEVCSGCGSYLKTIDIAVLSPFPLLSIADLETMDLDMAAMEHGYQRPPLKELVTKR